MRGYQEYDGCKGKTEKLSFGFCSGRASDNILADFILHTFLLDTD